MEWHQKQKWTASDQRLSATLENNRDNVILIKMNAPIISKYEPAVPDIPNSPFRRMQSRRFHIAELYIIPN